MSSEVPSHPPLTCTKCGEQYASGTACLNCSNDSVATDDQEDFSNEAVASQVYDDECIVEILDEVFVAEVVEEDVPVQTVINSGSPFRQEIQTAQLQGATLSNASAADSGYAAAISAMSGVHKADPAPVWMPEFESYSARGGAVCAVFLGVMAILGGLLTPMALFNAALGILLGLWGTNSQLKKTAAAGIMLCCLGVFVTIIRLLL